MRCKTEGYGNDKARRAVEGMELSVMERERAGRRAGGRAGGPAGRL
jgi:hypothetical protein